jgi:hypothetical protein
MNANSDFWAKPVVIGAQAKQQPQLATLSCIVETSIKGVLTGCIRRGTKIISNQGWINPNAAAERIVHWLREYGVTGWKVAAVSGSIITDRVLDITDAILENGQSIKTLHESMVSAEAYLSAEPIIEALKAGANIVVTGRPRR